MALSCPSERGKTSPCDRSSCHLAWTRMSSRGPATSRQIPHRRPRVAAGAAFPCPTRVALRSPAPHAGRGCRWPGCSGPPRSRCCPPTRGLCRIAADKWLECQVPPATTNKDMILEKKNFGYAKRVAHQKLYILDRHLFRDAYPPHSPLHGANPF